MKARLLVDEFKKYDLGPYIEVPCSILKPLISRLIRDKDCDVINPASEAIAMGLASGAYLARSRIPVLLMQNSGLCNVLNSLTSLNQLYCIPVLYLISWRGQPGVKDAPEHELMGAKLEKLLTVLGVPYFVLSETNFKEELSRAMKAIKKAKKPAALLLKHKLIDEERLSPVKHLSAMTKAKAIDIIMKLSRNKAYFVTTNGMISREAFYNLSQGGVEESEPLFYMLGSMGHALAMALGISRYVNSRKVIALDGDGGCLMHLEAMASVGKDKPKSLIHVVLDNGTYASTGGQPTVSRDIDFCKIAEGCGYKQVHRISKKSELEKIFPTLLQKNGPVFVHLLISNSEGKNRPRISDKYSCQQIKERFMKFVGLNES